MQASPKVSICIPTYNQVQHIGKALDSALTQDCDDLEVVVSENHCTDGTRELLDRVQDPRLRIVRPPEHLPVAQNFNFCAAHARGRYLSFLSSDNAFDPTFARKLADQLDANPGVAFAHCAAALVDGTGKVTGIERRVGGSYRRSGVQEVKRFLFNSRCVFDTMMIRRDCYERSGGLGILRKGSYFRELPDWDLDLRLLMTGDVIYFDEVLVQFRFWSAPNRDGNARRLPRYIEEIGRMFDTTVLELVEQAPELARDARRARKAMAMNCALGVGELKGLPQYEESTRNVKRIDDSIPIRLVLLAHDIGMSPFVNSVRTLKQWMRLRVKELLYQN